MTDDERGSSSGRTPGFGPGDEGSNPSPRDEQPEVHTRSHEGVGPHEIPGQLPTGEQLVFTVSLGTSEDGRLWVSLNDTPIGPPVPDEETGASIVAWFMGYLSTQVEGAVADHQRDQAGAAALLEQVEA